MKLRSWLRPGPRSLLAGAALLLAAALFDPGLPLRQPLYDHLVVFDVTQSMSVTDRAIDGRVVSRLVFARRRVRDALLELPCGSKLGLGMFTEYRSFLLLAPVEVCGSLPELRATLDHIDNRIAWTGNSEVAKGLYSAIGIAAGLPDHPSLVFVTDGHEAPPVNPRHRPPWNGKPGAVGGLLVGVGELRASPIPKSDPSGRPLGVWGADEVAQTDPRSRGRGGSREGEGLVEEGGDVAALPGATPGSEHLSGLREAYLRLLAGETGLVFHRLDRPEAFAEALTAAALARPIEARRSLAGALAVLALLLLLARHAGAARAAAGRLATALKGARGRLAARRTAARTTHAGRPLQ